MEAGNITERLVDWVNKVFGRLPGSYGCGRFDSLHWHAIAAATSAGAFATTAAVGGAIMFADDQGTVQQRRICRYYRPPAPVLGPVNSSQYPDDYLRFCHGRIHFGHVPAQRRYVGGSYGRFFPAAYNTWYAIKHQLPQHNKIILYTTFWKQHLAGLGGILMLPVIILRYIFRPFTPLETAAILQCYTTALMIAYGRFQAVPAGYRSVRSKHNRRYYANCCTFPTHFLSC